MNLYPKPKGLLTPTSISVLCSLLFSAPQRYPRNTKAEEFRYEIDFGATSLQKIARDGKIKKVVGPKIDVLSIEQNFGTVKFVENSDVTANEIVFRVRNRAADKYFLTRITSLLVSLGQKELLVGKEASELRANVTLASLTSNRLSGDVKCRRADVEVEVPTACLLDETKLVANVTKGHIRSRDLSAANFETVQVSDEGDEGGKGFPSLSLSLSLSHALLSLTLSLSIRLPLLVLLAAAAPRAHNRKRC